MAIDLAQFVPTFLEESFEGLDTMETCLLELQVGDVDTINTIFRAAHSIKGGSGTFGFDEVGHFTHQVETLLDLMRNGRIDVTPGLTALLLRSVDGVRNLLSAASEGLEIDRDRIAEIERELIAAVSEPGSVTLDAEAKAVSSVPPKAWRVHFKPESHLLSSGNDPLFLFRELGALGKLEIEVETSELPALEQLEPTELFLGWSLTLRADVPEASIREIFEWVEDECELGVEPLSREAPQANPPQGWSISFKPEAELLETGNDPLFILRELAELGELTIRVDDRSLPELAVLEPTKLRLAWELQLASDCDEAAVRAAFDWVEDQCALEITPLGAPQSELPAEPANNDPAPEHEKESPLAAQAPNKVSVSSPASDESSPATASAPVAPVKATKSARVATQDGGSIRVETAKVDALIDRVGELVITQAMLARVCELLGDLEHPALEQLREGLTQLERNTRDLQEDVMRVRMLPIGFVFNRLPRVVHDVSRKLGKRVELLLQGEQTELDKTVMEKIGDPLIHLLRNSLDHGLEMPEERLAVGKPEVGQILLNAFHEGGYIVIEISDDGRGLNRERIADKAIERGLIASAEYLSPQEIDELIFLPGFSTAEAVSDLSGRGVGMDVVRRNIESLGGHVALHSVPGEGTRFSVRLPLTLAILDGQLVKLGEDTYIVPLVSIVETIKAGESMLTPLGGSRCLLKFRGEYLPLINLRELFELPGEALPSSEHLIVIVEHAGQKMGLVVDDLMGQQQAVIKSLEVNFKRISGIAGATIMGDGSVALIVDVAGLIGIALDPEVAAAARKRTRKPEVE